MRRAMFGEEMVEEFYVGASPFQRPIQDWIAGAVWADVWTRGVLDRRIRSLVTLGVLVALNRPLELERHLLAARANGCTDEEIQEALLHVAPYCGAPAAMSAFRLAEAVLVPETDPGADRASDRDPDWERWEPDGEALQGPGELRPDPDTARDPRT